MYVRYITPFNGSTLHIANILFQFIGVSAALLQQLAQLYFHCLQQFLLPVQPAVARPPSPLGLLLLPGAQQERPHGPPDHFDADQVVSQEQFQFQRHLPARHYSNAEEAVLLVLHPSLTNLRIGFQPIEVYDTFLSGMIPVLDFKEYFPKHIYRLIRRCHSNFTPCSW